MDKTVDTVAWFPMITWFLLIFIPKKDLYYALAETSFIYRFLLLFALSLSMFLWGINTDKEVPLTFTLIATILFIISTAIFVPTLRSYTHIETETSLLESIIVVGIWVTNIISANGFGRHIRGCVNTDRK